MNMALSMMNLQISVAVLKCFLDFQMSKTKCAIQISEEESARVANETKKHKGR